ncbi:hypothetical protein BH10BAC5_BH10BAC5_04200 [soil metagenome]
MEARKAKEHAAEKIQKEEKCNDSAGTTTKQQKTSESKNTGKEFIKANKTVKS